MLVESVRLMRIFSASIRSHEGIAFNPVRKLRGIPDFEFLFYAVIFYK